MITTIHPRSKEDIDRQIENLHKAARKIFRTKESGRKFLIKAGFITKSGKWTKRYGG